MSDFRVGRGGGSKMDPKIRTSFVYVLLAYISTKSKYVLSPFSTDPRLTKTLFELIVKRFSLWNRYRPYFKPLGVYNVCILLV